MNDTTIEMWCSLQMHSDDVSEKKNEKKIS